MTVDLALRLAYGLNILILTPVLIGLWLASADKPSAVFEGRAPASVPLSRLVASLWSAILLCSVVGLWRPSLMVPILVLQVIYKSLWLVTGALPMIRRGGPPWGVAVSFVVIVAVWPWIIWAAWR